MKKRVRLEPQHDLIARMASEGKLSAEIAEATGSCSGSIAQYIRKHQIPWKPDHSRWRHGHIGACEVHHETVKSMAEAGATLDLIGEVVGTTRHRVREYLDRVGIQRPAWREDCRPVGPLNPAWTGGRMLDKDGYVLLWMPGHPEENNNGYVREHRIVMARTLGRPLRPGEVVDHRNDVRDDNRPENLRLFASNAEHLSVTLTGQHSRASRGLPPSTRKKSSRGAQQSLAATTRQPE